jgi:hypothetical protein
LPVDSKKKEIKIKKKSNKPVVASIVIGTKANGGEGTGVEPVFVEFLIQTELGGCNFSHFYKKTAKNILIFRMVVILRIFTKKIAKNILFCCILL